MAKKSRKKKKTRKKKVKVAGDNLPEPVGDCPESTEAPPEPVGDCPENPRYPDYPTVTVVDVSVIDQEVEDMSSPDQSMCEDPTEDMSPRASSYSPSISDRLVRLARSVGRGTDHIVSDSYAAQVYNRQKYIEDNQRFAAQIVADIEASAEGLIPDEDQ